MTGIKAIAVEDGSLRCEQEVPGGRDVYVVPLPAVVTVKEGLNLPRYPSVPGRLRAKRKPLEATSPARPRTEARDGQADPAAGLGQAGRGARQRRRGGPAGGRACSTSWGSSDEQVLVFVERRRTDELSQQALDVRAEHRRRRGRTRSAIDDRGRLRHPAALGDRRSAAAPTRGARPRDVVVAPGTERGNEVLAHVAALLDLPMAANCIVG